MLTPCTIVSPLTVCERWPHSSRPVLILGARQVGKTTLARAAFPDHAYLDLETPRLRELFAEDPAFHVGARTAGGQGVVLDEAQAVPGLFEALRGIIDGARDARACFILLGSAQPTLVRGVAESLAGRSAWLNSTAGRRRKLAAEPTLPWQRLWLAAAPDAARGDFSGWHEAYLRAYVERDLPQLGLEADPVFTRRLLTMLAHQRATAQVSASPARSGSATPAWPRAGVLERTFLLRRLPPFPQCRQAPDQVAKAYLRDTGLLHHLLNIAAS